MPPPAVPPSSGTNSKAVAGLVLGILSIVLALCCSPLGVVLGLGGAVLGYLAKQEIAQSPYPVPGAGVAQGAFVTGIVGAALSVLVFVVSLVSSMGTTTGLFRSFM